MIALRKPQPDTCPGAETRRSPRFPTFLPFIAAPVLAFTLAAPALAATILVPAGQPTIQAAINVANPGDTVLVSAGTYAEFIDFLGKAITVRSASGPGLTIIDAPNARTQKDSAFRHLERRSLPDGRVEVVDSQGERFLDSEGRRSRRSRGAGNQGSTILFTNNETRQAVLEGFTITGGDADFGGGGIHIEGSAAPTILGNIISGNRACTGGAGIRISFSSPLIQNNVITGNQQFGCSGGGGGGVEIIGSASAELRGNRITGNSFTSGGGISLFAAGTPIVANNVIENNTASSGGGGLDIVNVSNVALTQNLFRGNTGGSSDGDAIDWLVPSGAQGPTVVNNTITRNGNLEVLADGFDVAARLIGNIIVANTSGTAVFCGNFNDPNPPIFRSNNVRAPSGTAYGGICGNPTGSNGNISADPLFLNAAAGNLRLQANSPSIDAGDNTAPNLPATDFEGFARIVDGDGNAVATTDQGAYEYEPPVFSDGFESGDTSAWI